MEIKFDVYFKKNLGTLCKDNEVDLDGKEAYANIDLNLVDRLEVNYSVGGTKYTDEVIMKDIDNKEILIPFKSDVVKKGLNEFEVVAYMKNGDIKVSQTYTYNIEEGIGEGKQSGSGESSDGHTHSNLNILNSITQTKVNEWNNKADATHSHSEYASKNHTHNASEIEGLENVDIDLSDYYTKSETDNKISEEIAKAQLGGSGEVDLSAYATKTYVDDEISKVDSKIEDISVADLSLEGNKLKLIDKKGSIVGNEVTLPVSEGGAFDTSAEFDNLNTENKTMIGAINEIAGRADVLNTKINGFALSIENNILKLMINGEVVSQVEIPVNSNIDVEKIELNKYICILKPNEKFDFSCLVLPENATNKTITYKTTNKLVANFDGNTLNAILKGYCKVVATSHNGIISECVVIVPTETPNAEGILKIPVYNNQYDWQCVHPSVVYFKEGWNGYKYWMAMTPFENENDKLENPSIVASNDLFNWEVPNGLVNPIVPTPSVGFNSDTELVFVNGFLECWYRPSGNGAETILVKKSSDGINWSEPEIALKSIGTTKALMCPCVSYVNNKYNVWFVDDQKKKIVYYEGETYSNLNKIREISINQVEGGTPWHMDVKFANGKFEMYFVAHDGIKTNDIYYCSSDDNITYTNPIKVLSGRKLEWDALMYRPYFLDIDDKRIIFYSALNIDRSKWYISLTTCNKSTPTVLNGVYTDTQIDTSKPVIKLSKNGVSDNSWKNDMDNSVSYDMVDCEVSSNSIQFNGSSSYILLPQNAFDTSKDFTIILNNSYDVLNTYPKVIGNIGNNGVSSRFNVGLADKSSFFYQAGSSIDFVDTSKASISTDYVTAIVRSGSSLNIYRDGELIVSNDNVNLMNILPMYIGKNGVNQNGYLNGKIKWFAVYQKSMNLEEINNETLKLNSI